VKAAAPTLAAFWVARTPQARRRFDTEFIILATKAIHAPSVPPSTFHVAAGLELRS